MSRYDSLVASIDRMIDEIEPSVSSEYCIYRVPQNIRKLNEEAYNSRVVSIGPFHHGDERFKSIEPFKKRYFKKLVQRNTRVGLKNYIEFLKGGEASVRQCYSEIVAMDSDEFMTMLLVDGCFIIELLLRTYNRGLRDADHSILLSPRLGNDIDHDLILLENQIPFFVLEGIFNLAMTDFEPLPLLDLTLYFFENYYKQKKPRSFISMKHFTDLILILHRPMSERSVKEFQYASSATELNEAGVKFTTGSSTCLLDINFSGGVLEIPCITLFDKTESLIRNLMALELCHYPHDSYMIDYFLFMDLLLNTPKDVDLLIQNGIIENGLGGSKQAADLFNNLNKNCAIMTGNFYFSGLCEELNAYCKVRRHKWKATLKRDYFSSPWRTASTSAAVVLLALTFIQTVCSVLGAAKADLKLHSLLNRIEEELGLNNTRQDYERLLNELNRIEEDPRYNITRQNKERLDKLNRLIQEKQVKWQPEQEHLEVGSYLKPVTEDFLIDVDAHIRLMKEKLSFYTDHNDYKKFQWACIYKVPEKLRRVNEDAYTPRVVSLGPYHRGKPRLEAMEPYKWRCLDRYLTRSSVNLDRVAELVILEYQRNARRNYQDSFDNISIQEFSQMMMLDCIFIIELILENVLEVSPEGGQPNAKIFDDPWIRHDILHDMMLLENQVPFEILAHLFSKCFEANTSTDVYILLGTYFRNVGIMDRPESTEHALPAHLVDFLGKSHCPTIEGKVSSRKGRLELTHSATELHEAGVKFERDKTVGNCLLDIQFSTKGVLKIPQLKVNKETQTLFRNLIAFEQRRRDEIQYITSYIILMDSLINTPKDVKLLVSCGVIENLLEDNELVSNLFNNLPKETIIDNKDFYFANVCEDLNKYSKDYWHQWKAAWLKSKQILRRDYFRNTWTTMSVVAAIILLILTVIQTVCSILQL